MSCEDSWNLSGIEASIQGHKVDSTRLLDRATFIFGAGRKSYEERLGGHGVYCICCAATLKETNLALLKGHQKSQTKPFT
jgi:hypothetical protein